VISLKRNQVVAREGDTVTQAFSRRSQQSRVRPFRQPWHNFFGLLLVVIGSTGRVEVCGARSSGSPLSLSKHKAFALVGSAILVQTALMKVVSLWRQHGGANAAAFQRSVIWNFAIPSPRALLVRCSSIRNSLF
jgi:hypothetical protein